MGRENEAVGRNLRAVTSLNLRKSYVGEGRDKNQMKEGFQNVELSAVN